jgi:hypothetical protein
MYAILPSGSLWELGVLLRAVNLLHGSNSLKTLPKDIVPEFGLLQDGIPIAL